MAAIVSKRAVSPVRVRVTPYTQGDIQYAFGPVQLGIEAAFTDVDPFVEAHTDFNETMLTLCDRNSSVIASTGSLFSASQAYILDLFLYLESSDGSGGESAQIEVFAYKVSTVGLEPSPIFSQSYGAGLSVIQGLRIPAVNFRIGFTDTNAITSDNVELGVYLRGS